MATMSVPKPDFLRYFSSRERVIASVAEDPVGTTLAIYDVAVGASGYVVRAVGGGDVVWAAGAGDGHREGYSSDRVTPAAPQCQPRALYASSSEGLCIQRDLSPITTP